ncbi:hypothetical protein EON63_19955 [archaeon]|nr:MAG: hypothetical protein EON63_19955 [archaeon]
MMSAHIFFSEVPLSPLSVPWPLTSCALFLALLLLNSYSLLHSEYVCVRVSVDALLCISSGTKRSGNLPAGGGRGKLVVNF